MAGEPSDFDPQTLWQSQPKEHAPMTLEQIHRKARQLHIRVRVRNISEYVGCVIVIAGLTPALLQHQSWIMRAGAALVMAAVVFIAWRIHRLAGTEPAPEGGAALIAAYRASLIRQRDALRSVGAWYLAPFAPGMVLLMLGRWFQLRPADRSVGLDHMIILLASAIVVLGFTIVWLINQRAADWLQRRIDEL